jgi:hypothetical protein
MVICKQCKKEIGCGSAIILAEGKKKLYFCNEEEKNLYLNEQSDKDEKRSCYEVIFSITKRGITIVYKTLNELSKRYRWNEILDALNKTKPSLEKYYNEKYKTDFAFARYIETCINNTYNNESEKVVQKVKYYMIKHSKQLATTLSYITGEEYKEFDDKFNEGYKCYSFVETEKLLNALEDIKALKKKYK